MIDYQAIIDSLTEDNVKTILDKLDIPFEDKGAYLLMPTYCHNHKSEDASHKLYYYKNYKNFQCYTNCGAQSIFKFLKNYYEAQDYDYSWYEDIYRLITDTTNYRAVDTFTTVKYNSLKGRYDTNGDIVQLEEYNDGVLGCFVKRYPTEWLNDGISKDAMDKFDIRYSISQNKIIIPHRDKDGRLVGIRGRALNEWEIENLGKYMPVQVEDVWYKHPLSMNLYGLYENKENIKRAGICFLSEGEKGTLQAESFNRPNCVLATCGSNLNKFQIRLLMHTCSPKEIVLCYDQEELDNKDTYFQKLLSICNKYKNYANFSFIYDRDHLLELKESPFDRGEEVFQSLLDKRVKVL